MTEKKRVELPPGCMITDRRTWERQQQRASRVESENRLYAERIQGLTVANEALRRRVAEAEDLALDALASAEQERSRADRGRTASDQSLKALRLSKRALDRVLEGSGRNSFGGALIDAHGAVTKAIAANAKIK